MMPKNHFHKESGIYYANLVLRCAKPHTWVWLAQKIGWHSNFILPLAPLFYNLWGQMVVGFHPCNMPHKCAKFGPRGYFSFWVTGEQRNVLRRRTTRRLQNIYACTSLPMYLWCWGWWIHITIPNQSQVVALIAKKKTTPLYSNIGPWGPHTSIYGENLPLWMCKWSIPITIPNQSQVAALVAKKK